MLCNVCLQGKPKKRKRGQGLENADQLEEFFAQNQCPSAEQKSDLAEKTGLELRQVSKWFEHKRKKARTAKSQAAEADGGDTPMDAAPSAAASGPNVLDADEPILLDDSEPEMPAARLTNAAAKPACTGNDAGAIQKNSAPEAAAPDSQKEAAAQGDIILPLTSRDDVLIQIKAEVEALQQHVTAGQPLVPLNQQPKSEPFSRGQV